MNEQHPVFQHRNGVEIQQLGRYMRKHFQIFDASNDEIISDNISSLNIKIVSSKDIVQKIYTMCHSLYCIAEGQVGLYIKSLGDKATMNVVKVMDKGEYFGTFNLIQNTPVTMQSVCESQQAVLIEVSKDFFDKHLKENEEKIIAHGINQFKKMPLFKSHPYYILKNIYLSSFQVKLRKNNFVFKENDDIHAIYVIKKGEFSIYKSFDWDQKQSNQLYLKKTSFSKQVKLSVMVEGQIFGEEDLVQGKQQRSYTAICDSSDGELYVIHSQVFLQKVYSNNFSKRTIQELLLQKNTLFNERMNTVQTTYIEKQSPRYTRTQPDQEESEKVVIPIIPSQCVTENNENKSKLIDRVQTANVNMNTPQRGQSHSPTKPNGEYDRIMERRMSPFKQLETSLFGNKEDMIFEGRSLDNKLLKITGTSPQQQQQPPPSPQTDMFSIEIDNKQKILLKQKQQQHYHYKNYLKNFEGNKFNALLKKTGYRRIDKNTVEKQHANEYDFIKIQPTQRLKSLDKNFQYFYGPELQSYNEIPIDGLSNGGSSGQRISDSYIKNDQFQIKLNQNNSFFDHDTHDYSLYQNQMKEFQEEGETPRGINENVPLDQNQINLLNISPEAIQYQYSVDPRKQFLGQQGQLYPNDLRAPNIIENEFILSIDPQYEGGVQISSLFQNEYLKNKNTMQNESNRNYVITEIEEEDRVSTQQSHQRKLKTESFSSQNNQQDFLFQQSTRQNTLSPQRGEKSLLIDNFDFMLSEKDDQILFSQKASTMKKFKDTPFISPDYCNTQLLNVNRSFNTVNTVENNSALRQKYNFTNMRSQSTRKQRTPQKYSTRSPLHDPIYSKDYISKQLNKFTLSSNKQNNGDNHILPNLSDSQKQHNGYRLPTLSQGLSRKNSPPLSPGNKSREEQKIFTHRQDLKKNIFLKLHLNNYEQKINTNTNVAETICIKNFKSPTKPIN